MDAKTLIDALAKVDRDHFIIVEADCVEVYRKTEFLPTPCEVSEEKDGKDLTNDPAKVCTATNLPCIECVPGYPCAKYRNTGDQSSPE